MDGDSHQRCARGRSGLGVVAPWVQWLGAERRRAPETMTTLVHGGSNSSPIPTRILIAGSDLLAGALASALETYGFATMHTALNEPDIERGIEWQPDLVLVDVRSLDIPAGSAMIEHLHRTGLQVCVVDSAEDGDRTAAWLQAGPAAIIDRGEPLEKLFRTITRVLRIGPPPRPARRSPTTFATTPSHQPQRDSRLQLFAALTERESVVLAELLEGHCAEEIAKAGFVSISTVRSQIKAILQKLGVNSQLAAVAVARHAGWSFHAPLQASSNPENGTRSRVS